MPPPTPPSVNEGRMIAGKPMSSTSRQRFLERRCATPLFGTSTPISLIALRNRRRSSATLIASICAPISLTLCLLENAALVERDGEVERRLAADGRQHGIRLLLGDDRFDHLRRERLDVGCVGQLRVGHDRRRVAVDQDHLEPFGAQRLARLCARVVELGRLADDDRPRADDEDALDVGALGHSGTFRVDQLRFHRLEELLEEIVGVVRPGRGLGMILHREDRLRDVPEALDGACRTGSGA